MTIGHIYLYHGLHYAVKYKMSYRVMHMRKFKLPAIPSSTPKTVRFPNDVIDQVEEAIRGTNLTFSAFVIEATRVALENLAEEDQ